MNVDVGGIGVGVPSSGGEMGITCVGVAGSMMVGVAVGGTGVGVWVGLGVMVGVSVGVGVAVGGGTRAINAGYVFPLAIAIS